MIVPVHLGLEDLSNGIQMLQAKDKLIPIAEPQAYTESVPLILGWRRNNTRGLAVFSKFELVACYSVLARLQLEYCVQFWDSQYKRDMELLEQAQ